MNIGKLVNEKVLLTFVCSMVSLLTLSSVLSHIDTNKNGQLVKASANETKEVKKELKVDMINVYNKNNVLTEAKPVVEETPQVEQPKVEEVKQPEPIVPHPVVTGSVQEYQEYAHSRFAEFGWSEEDFNALVQLWNRESGWNPASSNSRSGAYGIPQALPGSKMASFGEDWATNYQVQINWGLNYISGRYGNPTNAWNQLSTKGWY